MDEIEELVERLKTIEDRVKFLMEKYPHTRNSDLYLIILYWRYFDKLPIWFPSDFIFGDNKVTSPESIRRARQKIQARGELLPTNPEVSRRRRKAMKAYKRYASES